MVELGSEQLYRAYRDNDCQLEVERAVMDKLTVGQKLWFVPNARRHGIPCWVTVTKVGRMWANADKICNRINITTGHIDGKGYHSPGRVYLSHEAYAADSALQKEWEKFKSIVHKRWTIPAALTVADIKRAHELLKL
jgi:hypothetical protein